jgi:proline iminopeptidase
MDLSATTGLSPALLARIRDVFGRYPEVQRAVIYGSRAKGSFIPGSDIDLAVFAPEMSQTRFAALWSELDDLPLVFTLDVVHWDTLGNAGLKQRIVDEGIELVPRQAPEALTGV